MDSRHDSTISIRTYRRHVKRSNNTGDFFIFKRAYIKYGLLTITEAAFLQNLINLASMDKAEVDDNDWFLCSVNMLMESMCWSADSQKDLFAKLITKGYTKTEKRGIPPKRWVWINIEKIEIDLDMKEDENSQSGGKPPQQWGSPDQSGGKPPQRQKGKPPQYTLGEEVEQYVGALPQPRSIPFGSNGNGKHESPPHQLAKRLYQILQKKNKIMRKPQMSKWAEEFRHLLQLRPLIEINAALNWYEAKGLGKPYVPQPYSAKAFRDKFVGIEDAMIRSKDKNRSQADEDVLSF